MVKASREKLNLLGRNGGYVQDPRYALGGDSRYATVPPEAILDEEDYRRLKETERPPEPEGVSKEDLKWMTKEARERFGLMRDFEHDQRMATKQSLERRLTELVSIARERGIDVHADIQFIRRRLDRMESKVRDDKKAA